jgi:hypothetical protein
MFIKIFFKTVLQIMKLLIVLSLPRRPDGLWGLPSLLCNGYSGSSPGVRRPECEADHSLVINAEVKKTWIYASIPHSLSWLGA